MKRILFLGVGRRVELVQAFRSAALTLEKEIMIYGEDVSDSAPALAFCDRRFELCSVRDKEYIEQLLKKSTAENIDLIIPTIDTHLQILADNRDRFAERKVKVLISSPEMVGMCRDKRLTSRFFAECGLYTPMPVSDWKLYKGGYPAFIKPKDGSSSIHAYKAADERELEVYAGQLEDYIVQPYIDGIEYTVDLFADFEWNPVYVTPRRRILVRAGEVLKTEIDLDRQIIDECRRLADRFRPCGPITIQLIRDYAGKDWFIEINPRFGGGSPLSMKAGADSAAALLQLLDNEMTEIHNVLDGAVYTRFDQSVCIRSGFNMEQVRGVIFDLDDTLYNEKEYVKSGFRKVSEYLGEESAESQLWEAFRNGKPAFDEVLWRSGRFKEKEACLRIYRNHMPELHLREEVEKIIGALKDCGLKIGIITDGRAEGQKNKIKALGLDSLIGEENIIITDELGGTAFRKPCDIAFRIMARRWELNYENIVYIGDNADKDFQAANQLGMQSIRYKSEDGLYQNGDYNGITVTDIRELGKYLGMTVSELE